MFAPGFCLFIVAAVLGVDIEPVATEIDGQWKLVSACDDGHEELGEEKTRESELLYQLEKGVMRFSEHSRRGEAANHDAKESEEDEDDTKVEYRLNPTTAPKQIDWFVKSADDKDARKFQGIYRITDDDLILCFSLEDDSAAGEDILSDGKPSLIPAQSPRPTTFEQALQTIWTLKRVPAEKKSE